MTTTTPDLRYSRQLFHSLGRELGIEFDHADGDRFTRVVWLWPEERNPYEIKRAIESRGFSARDNVYAHCVMCSREGAICKSEFPDILQDQICASCNYDLRSV